MEWLTAPTPIWLLLLVAALAVRLSFMHERKNENLDKKIEQLREDMDERDRLR